MAGPLSGIGSASQFVVSQYQTQQTSNTQVRDTEKKPEDSESVVSSSPLKESSEVETDNSSDVTKQNVVQASADEQTLRDEKERGSILDISV